MNNQIIGVGIAGFLLGAAYALWGASRTFKKANDNSFEMGRFAGRMEAIVERFELEMNKNDK